MLKLRPENIYKFVVAFMAELIFYLIVTYLAKPDLCFFFEL